MKRIKKEAATGFLAEYNVPVKRNSLQVVTPGNKIVEYPLSYASNRFSAQMGSFGAFREELVQGKVLLNGSITLEVATNEPFLVVSPFEVPKLKSGSPYFMIPAVLYGSNAFGISTGRQPKLDYGGAIGFHSSSKFMFRADRSTHPGIIYIANGNLFMVGVDDTVEETPLVQADKWSPAWLYNGILLDTSHPDKDIFGYTFGYAHFPARYGWEWPDEGVPGKEHYRFGFIEGMKGKELKIKTRYYHCEAPAIHAYGQAIRRYYVDVHESPKRRGNREEAVIFMANIIVNDCWLPEERIFYLSDHESGRAIGCIAWTGGMQVAYPLLKAGLRYNQARYIACAIDFIDELTTNAMNQNAGLFNEEKRNGIWQVTGWWGTRKDCLDFGDNPLHSAYLNGQATYYLLRAYVLTGNQNEGWLNAATQVIETAIRGQRADGAYPCFFSPNEGMPAGYIGYQGCWFAPGAVLLYRITGKKKYLKSACKATEYYFQWHLTGELYGTPMDTHNAVDEEGNLAFIGACVELHKLTGKQLYLDYAMTGLDWEFSWKFPRNIRFSNDPLKSMDWSSCGGSITSTHNPHIHPMGNLIASEMYYVWQQTADRYIYQRLRDTCIWGLGCYNRFDGEFGFGKKGGTTEQFFHSDALICPWNRPWDGGVWESNLSWASACYLLSAADDIPDEFFN